MHLVKVRAYVCIHHSKAAKVLVETSRAAPPRLALGVYLNCGADPPARS